MGPMALPPSSKYLQRGDEPVDDAERDSMTVRLNAAFADGRITHEQYAESMEHLYAARRLADLVPVVEHLPAPAPEVPAIVEKGTAPAGRLAESRDMRPAAFAVVAVGAVLIAVLAILVVFLFFL